MHNFIKIVNKLDVERSLKIAAILIFLFKMVDVLLALIVPMRKFGFGFLTSPWAFGIASNFFSQFCLALYQPLILLALARIIDLKKRGLSIAG